ncbi:MAG: SAVED domain-containing protein [Erysipelotrichales bacterium]|nr:SAVED domain-containing protein [Erysipelotrichales bacterium]
MIELFKFVWQLIEIYKKIKKQYDKNIIYVNCNKKFLGEDMRTFEKEIGLQNSNVIQLYTLNDKYYKLHLKKMKYIWKRFNKSKKYSKTLYYTGCVSVPLAIYDGYMASNKANIVFLENNKNTNKKYIVKSSKKHIDYDINYEIENSLEDINVVINSSYDISTDKLPKRNSIFLNVRMKNEVISKEYLDFVYEECLKLFDYLDYKNVKNIHLYVAARQSIAFTIGSSIQKHHPNVYCYEYENGNYTWKINIKEGRIQK